MRIRQHCGLLAFASVFAILAFTKPVVAGAGNADVCENGMDSNLVIEACTPIIDAGGTRDLSLGLALDDRCSARNDIGQFDLALQDCETAIRLNADFARSYNNRGNAHAGKQEYRLAIADYDHAIRLDPNFEFAYYNRALAREALGDYAQAVEDYTAAIRASPQDADNYMARCHNYAILG